MGDGNESGALFSRTPSGVDMCGISCTFLALEVWFSCTLV